ncbi:MAG: hypothetical protein ABII90_01480 [Bacteroidota bacterium]
MFIQIDYDIKVGLSKIVIGFGIYSKKFIDAPLIGITDVELAPSRLRKRRKGYYQCLIEIPEKILNVGNHSIRVNVTDLSNIGDKLDVIDNVNFTVIDNVGIFQALGLPQKGSLLSLQQKWNIVEFDSQPEEIPDILL